MLRESRWGQSLCYLSSCGKQKVEATHLVTIGSDVYPMCEQHTLEYAKPKGNGIAHPIDHEPDSEARMW